MIEIQNLTKRYGSKKAVDSVSFTVEKGEILGFLGPNGAGKTTTMNIITGYISSTSGTVLVDGLDILKKPEEVKAKIGYLPENPPLYPEMTVADYLRFVFDLKKIKEKKRDEHIREVMETVKISDVSGRLIRNLSKGYKQRVGLAQALLGDPEILILDEPTVGLDPKQINEIRSVIKSLGKKRTIILSSHILPEVSAICERVIIINKGKIVASDTPDNLSRSLSSNTHLTVRVEGEKHVVRPLLGAIAGIREISDKKAEEGAYDYFIKTEEDADIRRDIFRAMAKAELPILMMSAQNLTLEDVFLKLTAQQEGTIALTEHHEEADPLEPPEALAAPADGESPGQDEADAMEKEESGDESHTQS